MGKDTTVMKTDFATNEISFIFSLEFEKNMALVRFENATPGYQQKFLALMLALRKSRKWL